MFHLGGNVLCPRDSIIGIFDLDTATVSRHTRDFLRRAQEGGDVVAIGDDLPQSFVVMGVFGGKAAGKVYLSSQSSGNLSKKLLTTP